jgi:hypothetical protein
MEPIVLIGLIAVCYGGYIAVTDLWEDISALIPRRVIKENRLCGRREASLQPPVKKMAGLYV